MSEIAGRLAPQVGAHYLERTHGGRGVLLGGVPGVPPAEVVVLGGGVSGTHAATIALGMGATVFVVDRSAEVLRRIAAQFPGVRTIFSTRDALGHILRRADLLIGAVLVPGAAAPKLVSRAMVATMKPGSVIVDIAIDQGGCCETSRPTSHSHPTYVEEGVIHYCVTNMPGAVARTSTFALNNATLPFVLALADKGWRRAIADDPHLRNGLNVHAGKLTCRPVAEALGLPYTAPGSAAGPFLATPSRYTPAATPKTGRLRRKRHVENSPPRAGRHERRLRVCALPSSAPTARSTIPVSPTRRSSSATPIPIAGRCRPMA